ELALRGYINPHQRLMLKTILVHIEFLTEQIELLNEEVATRLSYSNSPIYLFYKFPHRSE
ncbi:hypothetical protein MPH47_21130, partial [Psychrobacillus psychrodurans]|nr:hypothetical protein [Psychrobacillus psychrodurans]